MSEVRTREFLGIDYGRRRVGLAKSDPTGTIATALQTLEVKSNSEAVEKIGETLKQYEFDGIVIGYPLLSSGDKSKICLEIDSFIIRLKNIFDKPIYKVDESYSSQEAADIVHAHGKRAGKDKKRLDRLAAVLILQRFLDEPDS